MLTIPSLAWPGAILPRVPMEQRSISKKGRQTRKKDRSRKDGDAYFEQIAKDLERKVQVAGDSPF